MKNINDEIGSAILGGLSDVISIYDVFKKRYGNGVMVSILTNDMEISKSTFDTVVKFMDYHNYSLLSFGCDIINEKIFFRFTKVD